MADRHGGSAGRWCCSGGLRSVLVADNSIRPASRLPGVLWERTPTLLTSETLYVFVAGEKQIAEVSDRHPTCRCV